MLPAENQPPSPDSSPAPLAERRPVLLWHATVILTGAVIMGLELVAFRLYAPYFGYSIYVWGSMISVVMGALAVGYALGGWLADRSRTDAPLYLTIVGCGFYQLVLVFTVQRLLQSLWRSGEFVGTILATLAIFGPPMTGLAATSPFVIRLMGRAGHLGSTAGRVYALSTAGSIAGVLGTSFFLVPQFGTRATLEILCAVSAAVGLAGLAHRRRAALLAVATIAALPLVPPEKLPSMEIWRSESAYNLVRVMHHGKLRWLVLNDARYAHTIEDQSTGWSGYYQDDFALGPLLVAARRLLVLGMGAGGSIRATRAVAPDVDIDAVEIDPQVVEASARFFGLRPDTRLRIHVADARPWLARNRGSYDLIHVDLYHGGPYVPFYLVTVEFFELVRARASEDGLLMMNVYDLSEDRELLNATGATLRQVFPSVAVLSRPDGGHLLLAFPRARAAVSLRARLASVEGSEVVRHAAERAASSLVDFAPRAGSPVFTDDHAPIEAITRRMLAARQP